MHEVEELDAQVSTTRGGVRSAAMRLCVLLVFLLVGCGRSTPFDPAGSSTLPPQLLNDACVSGCTSAPPAAKTPLTMTSGGRPLHWAHCGRCIEVTLDPELPAEIAAQVPITLAAWADAIGPALCLRMGGVAPRPETSDVRRIHVALLAPGGTTVTLTTNRFEQSSGRMLQALVEVSKTARVERTLTYALGQALGLGRSLDTKASALSPELEGLTVPGSDDVATLRAMYGPPAWCTH
jgi:hypothetical protein